MKRVKRPDVVRVLQEEYANPNVQGPCVPEGTKPEDVPEFPPYEGPPPPKDGARARPMPARGEVSGVFLGSVGDAPAACAEAWPTT